MSRKMSLDENAVKYIFGAGTEPDIAIGEDGYVIYNFRATFPSKLAVFVPIEIEGSNYSNFFPRSFDDHFRDLDLEISRLSLLIERGNIFNRFHETEFVPGQVLKTAGEYTVFRFDEGLDTLSKDELLCRSPIERMSLSDIDRCQQVTDVDFLEYADAIYGEKFLYWFLPVERLFAHDKEIPVGIMPMVMESLCR